jgi:hypothetical protein
MPSAAASYPPVILTVDVESDASTSVTNTATISGGGDESFGETFVFVKTMSRRRRNTSKAPSCPSMGYFMDDEAPLRRRVLTETSWNGRVVSDLWMCFSRLRRKPDERAPDITAVDGNYSHYSS